MEGQVDAAALFKDLPKVELHVHLDCSLSYQAVSRLSTSMTYEEYKRDFVAPSSCRDLAEFLACVVRSVDTMQSRAALRLAVESLFRQWQEDNVIYGELRFAPLLHTNASLAPETVVESVLDAVREQSLETGIHGSVILCTLRHFSEAESLETAKLVKRFASEGVVGLDLAADEAAYPVEPHIAAFRVVREAGLSTTAHAGEARGADSVRETLHQLQPMRIGHGVRSIEDEAVVDEIVAANVHLEICPAVNLQIGIFSNLAEHSIAALRAKGVSVGISCDGRSVVGTNLNRDYERIAETFGWRASDFRKANLCAAEAAFVDEASREELKRRLA